MSRWSLTSGWQAVLILLIVLTALGFATQQYVEVGSGEILIRFDDGHAHFVNEEEVREALMHVAEENAALATTREVNLEMLEGELMLFSFVEDAQASRDLSGNLVIDVKQDEPIARLVAPSGKGAYISREQRLLPLSRRFTPRIIALTGAGADSLLSETFLRSYRGQQVYKLINHINTDEFLSKQIAEVNVNRWMGITLHPQIGRQAIEFGKAKDFDKKFRKLQTFYREIVPRRGWNEYSIVKLQYDKQIVCKK